MQERKPKLIKNIFDPRAFNIFVKALSQDQKYKILHKAMAPQLQTRQLGKDGPQVTALGWGAMGISGRSCISSYFSPFCLSF